MYIAELPSALKSSCDVAVQLLSMSFNTLLLQADMDVGSVCDLRHVKHAIATARAVMDYTTHTTLSGLQATAFALEMGLKLTNLSTPASSHTYYSW